MEHKPKDVHTVKMTVKLTVLAPVGATVQDVEDYVYDLEWAGGCRNPEEDLMFDSLHVENVTVRRARK